MTPPNAPTEREPICPGCGHEGHAGFCDECGCLDDRTFKPAPPNAPRPDDPYRDCAVYLEHGACVCSTGYPASCQADQPSQHAPTNMENNDG